MKQLCKVTGLMIAFGLTSGSVTAEQVRTVAAGKLYHDYCSVCHGDKGDGRSHAMGSFNPPPKDFTSPAAAVALTRERMIASIRDGKPGTAMAAWSNQLSAQQIEDIADYIRKEFMPPVANTNQSEGKQLFAANCSVCHGDSGRGAAWGASNMSPAPRNFTTEESLRELTRERMIRSATFGRADTAMPGFGSQLSKAEIESVVDYIRTSIMKSDKLSAQVQLKPEQSDRQTTALVDMSSPLPGGLVGSHARGQAFYIANCVACHGVGGDGRGPRAYFILPKPRDFTHAESRHKLNRTAIFDAISKGRNGTEMPAWRTVLDKQTIADISEYVFASFIQPDKNKPVSQ